MVLRALRPFSSHPDVAHVVLVLPPEDAAHPPAFLSDSLRPAPSFPGAAIGETRSGPACRRCRRECTVVLVHDGGPAVRRART